MAEAAENYHSIEIQKYFRGQAFRVWAVAAGVIFVWVALIVLPVAVSPDISSPIYYFFSFICHQLPERSFHFHDHQFAVCSRCFGVYFGLLFGFLIYPLWRKIDNVDQLPRIWLFLSLIPIGVDWSLSMLGLWENTHLSRFVTGLILGVSCGSFIIPALVEIAGNMTNKRTKSRVDL